MRMRNRARVSRAKGSRRESRRSVIMTDRETEDVRKTETVRRAEEVTGRTGTVGRIVRRAVERADSRTAGRTVRRAVEKEDSRTVGRTVRRAVERADSRTAERIVRRAVEKEDSRIVGRTVRRAVEKEDSRTAEKEDSRTAERTVRRMAGNGIMNAGERTSSGSRETADGITDIIVTETITDPDRKESLDKMTINLKDKERLDELQRNGYKIIQNPDKFCFGMDAVLLCAFARAKKTDTLLDLGTGTGIIPLLMEARYGCSHLTGLEIQPESADMAARSVALNGLEEKIEIVTGDIKEADKIFASASFDCITCNPPYMIGQHGLTNPEEPKAIARHELLCAFRDVARQAGKLLKPGGHFFLVHRPFRLAEIIVTLSEYSLEPKRMQLVYPYEDKEPNMVLLEAVRGGKPRMTVEKPLIVFESPGVYRAEIRDIYGF